MNKFLEDDLLPISLLSDFIFCPRRAALHQIEGIWTDNRFTAEGTVLHEKADVEGKTESRGDLRIARGLRIRSLTLGLIGKMDIVEFNRVENDGIELRDVKGKWQIFPVEYKRGIMRHEKSFEVQLCAQTLCLEEIFNTIIMKGAIFYGKSEHRYDVEFSDSLRQETIKAISQLHELIKTGKTPTAEYNKRCEKCSLLHVCLPKKRDVIRYIESQISDL